MSESAPSDALRQYGPVVESSPWAVALLAPDGRILAASAPAWELLGAARGDGRTIEQCLAPHDRERLRGMLAAASTGGPLRLDLAHVPGQDGARPVEIQLSSLRDLGFPFLTAILSPPAEQRRRELVLTCNLLAPRLLRASAAHEVYRLVAETMRVIGIGISLYELDRGGEQLRLVYDTAAAAAYDVVRTVSSTVVDIGPIPASTPLLSQALTSRRALHHGDGLEMLAEMYPPAAREHIYAMQRVSGMSGYIYAPLVAEDAVQGVLIVWGPHLSPGDVPFMEAFALQIGAALGQVALRQRMEQQIERLSSLATTARAVTSLGAIEGVLEVVCDQTRALLGGHSSSLALPSDDGQWLEIRTAVGGRADCVGTRLPVEGSLFGRVFRSGAGLNVADTRTAPDVYPAPLVDNPIHAVIFQPLVHGGAALGVLSVGHEQPGYFSEADLDYLGRYAEYAALAIANARLYREAEAARRYLDALIQSAPDAMLIIRPDMTLHPLNAAPAHAFGYQRGDLEGQSFLSFVAPEQREQALEHWRAALRGEAPRFEIELLRVSGARYHALVSVSHIPGYDEILATVRDVTEQRRLEAEIRQSEKLAALGRMVAGAAHELNNPLAVVLGLAQLQLQEDLPPATRNDMAAIERAAQRAATIVQQLRLFARPQPLAPQPVDLRAVVEAALARLATQIAASRAQVVRELRAEPLVVAGEPLQLEQVLVNIVQNAVQAVAENPPGAPRTITLGAWRDQAHVWLTVRDNGPGIAPEHLSRLFEPFFTTREVGAGLGLGLALVHALVQQHAGAVSVASAPGCGALFELRLPPAAGAHAQDAASHADLPPGAHILLAEDDEQVRAVAARTLRRLGCAVDAVSSGEEALARALHGSYDLVISDMKMPGMDGPALYERLRAQRPGLRWLILTGDTMGERSRDFLDRSALPVLPKPFTSAQLARSVAECLAAL